MALGYRQSPILLPGIGSFMAQELIQDFCSSANTVAMGTKEQLPCNWINIRLLLRHSAPRRELVQVPPPAPSTWSWICMAPVINVHSACNVCGAAYMVDKQLYVNYAVMVYIRSVDHLYSPPGPLRWCWCCVRLMSGITETSSGSESELLVYFSGHNWRKLQLFLDLSVLNL